jgi:hypothetical protein
LLIITERFGGTPLCKFELRARPPSRTAGAFRNALSGAALIGMLVLLLPQDSLAQPVTGSTVSVRPQASLSNPEGTRTLVVGQDVVMGDRIRTDGGGEAQLLFTDDTRLVVGPNSSLVIEAYLLRSNRRASNFTVRALGGSFRMITGRSDKSAYRIRTPGGTIGVRGTAFDFTVSGRRLGLLLYSGAARICSGGGCRTVSGFCSLAEAGGNRGVRVQSDRGARDAEIRRSFRYAVSQRSLRRDFRLRTRGCGSDRASYETKDRERTRLERRTRTAPEPTKPDKPDKQHHGHHGRHKDRDGGYHGGRHDYGGGRRGHRR